MRSAKHVSINELKKQPRLGMSLAEEMEKFTKNMAELDSAGVAATIAKQMDTFAASLKGVGATLKDINKLVSANINEFAALSAGVGRSIAYFDDYAKATLKSIKNQSFLIESQKALQKEFKMSSAGAFDFSKKLRAIDIQIGDAKLFKYAAGLGKITGGFITATEGNKKLINSLIKSQAFLQNNLGLSEEGAQKFELFSRSMGIDAVASIDNITKIAQTFSDATGQDQTQLMSQMVEDISSMGADVATQFGRVPGQLEAATMKARLLGTTMGELSAVGDKLLNIESSIGTEMEYQQLTGHRLLTNSGKSLTNEYRMAQLKGDGVKQASLMQQFLEKEGDTLKTSYIARQKASELFGIDGAKLLEMNAQLKLQKELGVQSLVDQAEGNLKTLEASLRSDSNLSAENIDKVLKGAAAAADVRTPTERSADSLDAIKKDIAFIGQGGSIDSKGKRGEGTTMGKEFMAGLQTSIDASLKFAEKASKTFTETNFIKGIGTLGVLGDRITESITPIQQMATTLPGILGTGLTNLISAVSNGLKRVKDPYALGVEPDQLEATGGYISGPGSGTSDSIPARLSDGEYVINAAATRRNKSLLDKINSGGPVGYAAGGAVTSTARMESLLSSILVAMRGSNVMGATSMNGRKRI
jgi:hypothetical protein